MGFSVQFCHESLTFTAEHFVFYRSVSDGRLVVEELHSHLFRVWMEVAGPLDDWDMVVDFVPAEKCLRDILHNLDNKVFLPDRSPHLHCCQHGDEVVVTFSTQVSQTDEHTTPPELRFSAANIVWLSGINATTERIAEWLLQKTQQDFQMFMKKYEWYEFRVEVEESSGCIAKVSSRYSQI